MRYLGIDPGTTRIGFGVIEERDGSYRSLEWGIISNPGKNQSLDKVSTVQQLTEILHRWSPSAVGIERLFFMNNQRTAMSVSEMRGVLMLTLTQHNLPISEFTPQQVKQTITGHGGADKKQMQRMMQLLLHISEPIKPDDAADALALALCCATAPKKY